MRVPGSGFGVQFYVQQPMLPAKAGGTAFLFPGLRVEGLEGTRVEGLGLTQHLRTKPQP